MIDKQTRNPGTEYVHMFFEQGPIRPPSEAGSLLLRFTRNCPWNKCTFCPIYKGQSFSRRPPKDILADIDAVRSIIDDLHDRSTQIGHGGHISRQVLNDVLTSPSTSACYRHVALWHFNGEGSVFIQDANSMIMATGVLVEALRYLKTNIPGIRRITSYARSSTIARKSGEELKEIREAGLDRIHIGLESGSDRVLSFVRKGVTAAQHIEAGQKAVQAGMELSEYVMPGLGGKSMSRDHATETARVLNAIDPHFIRLRSLRIPPRTLLHQDNLKGRMTPLSDDETVQEIRLFIESLDGIRSYLSSDHVMNLLEEVEGVLPDDKQAMLAAIDRYLSLPDRERLLYRLGRRGGALRAMDDLNDPLMRARLERALNDLAAEVGGDVERVITELGDRYI
jgi:radical SAM superfamily enzyme YgiQ (UPF0313 family)